MTVEAARTANLKHVAALIAAVAALVTSVSAFYRKPPEEDAKTAYETLSKAMEKVSADTVQNHEDLLAMHNFLEGYIRAREQGTTATVVDAGTVPAIAATPIVHLKPVVSSAPPPPMSPAPAPYKSLTFAAVKAAKAD
jgi:hypothetical protein